MRTAVQRDDPGLMNHLRENHHMFRRLEHLKNVVVFAWHNRRTGTEPQQTPLRQTDIFRAMRRGSQHNPLGNGALVPYPGASLRLRCQTRDSPIRWVHDQRRPLVLSDRRAVIPPELVVRELHVKLRVVVTTILVSSLQGLLHKRRGFLVCEEPFAGHLGGTLQRRQRAEVPHPSQIWVAP